LKTGTYCEAQDLTAGVSLTPLYRRLSDKKHSIHGYELVHAGGRELFTHRLGDHLTRVGNCSICEMPISDKKHCVRHHKDFNKRNNVPENIQWVTEEEHLSIHRNTGSENLKRLWKSPELREKMKLVSREVGKKTWKLAFSAYRGSSKHRETGRK